MLLAEQIASVGEWHAAMEVGLRVLDGSRMAGGLISCF